MGRLSLLLISVTLINNWGSFAFHGFQPASFDVPALNVEEPHTKEEVKLMKVAQQTLKEEVSNLTSSMKNMEHLLKNAMTVKEQTISRKESEKSLAKKVESLESSMKDVKETVTSLRVGHQSMKTEVESLVSSVSLVMSMKESQQSLKKKIESLASTMKHDEENTEKGGSCPVLDQQDYIPSNSHPDRNETGEGVVVHFLCDNGYYQCGDMASAKCASDGNWVVSKVSDCVVKNKIIQNPINDVKLPFPCTLPIGSVVTFRGVPTKATRFELNLQDDEGYLVLHTSIRFNDPRSRRQVVVNNKVNNVWRREHRPDPFPFEVNQNFTLIIKLTPTGYQVFDGDTYLYDYGYRGGKPAAAFYKKSVVGYAFEWSYP